MKKLIIYMTLSAALAGTACTVNSKTYDVETRVIIDATDRLAAYPTADEIIDPLNLKNYPWQGCKISCTYISDLDVNTTTVFTLERQNEWSGNIVTRRAQIRSFTKKLQRCLSAMRPTESRQHSIIYRTIARQCNQLAASTAKKRYCLVFSDLMENSTTMNFYRPETTNKLHKDPRPIQRRLEQAVPVTSLRGLDVWLLYSPGSYHANNTYMDVAEFYQGLLSGHGAAVHIANRFQ
ncbi:MAG TPA: hypothetical protein VHA56_07305 [Mucilaginibacter sp.]|nr:hypothetical protein [Mucilaginibacter sp.]